MKSRYLDNPARLADVIAALQVMGTYRFATRPIEKWTRRLGRRPVSAENWSQVFMQHPEFFTLQGDVASLVWRRSRERNYDTFQRRLLSRDEAMSMAQEDDGAIETRLSRPPLDTAEISKLIDIAVNLHEREIKHRQETRWWLTFAIAAVGVLATMLSKL